MLKRLFIGLFLVSSTASAEIDPAAILPPTLPWAGRSRELIVPATDPWVTPVERSSFRMSPDYEETMAWLRKLDEAAPEIQMVSIGKSAEGRDIWMVIASRERAFTPEALRRSAKPILFAHGGIHAGEIDGKDAGMMLLREITVGRRRTDLLDRATLLFVPILNVDGHERASRYGRMNQRGPEVMGWRTNARNLNLNRDFTKLDTEEVRAVVSAIGRWQPDLYLDLHVTDGADYQYDITYGWNRTTGYSPSIVRWLDQTLKPALDRSLRAAGHIPGPLVFPVEWQNLANGISMGNSTTRFSTGYGDVRHLATALVENHSLKPYEQRVLGTVVLLTSAMETLGASAQSLRRASAEDQRRRIDPIPMAWSDPELQPGAEIDQFLGVESRVSLSPISGTVKREWLGRPITMRVPVFGLQKVIASAARPKAWWIPAAWSHIAERVRAHGIIMERTTAPRELDVEMYRLQDPKLDAEAFEGHVPLKTGAVLERRTIRFSAGSWRIPADQPLGDLAAVLLEPLSPDSFLQWGFMNEILQRTEYAEDYVTEALAQQMLAADLNLAAEFQRKLAADPAFRASADARLRWFYERTPFWDDRWLLYPVARER